MNEKILAAYLFYRVWSLVQFRDVELYFIFTIIITLDHVLVIDSINTA